MTVNTSQIVNKRSRIGGSSEVYLFAGMVNINNNNTELDPCILKKSFEMQ